jgi:hypothetical protein
MQAFGSPPGVAVAVGAGGAVEEGGGVVAVLAGGVVAAGGEDVLPFDVLVLCFGGTFVDAALPPLSAGLEPSSSVLDGAVGAEQPASAATPMLETASMERATSWVTAFICRILWLRSPCSVSPWVAAVGPTDGARRSPPRDPSNAVNTRARPGSRRTASWGVVARANPSEGRVGPANPESTRLPGNARRRMHS